MEVRVHVIITTRCSDDDLLELGSVTRLQPLDDHTALATMLRYSGHGDGRSLNDTELANAQQLANDPPVERLPLALRHVGSHVKETRISFSTYRDRLVDRKKTLRVRACNLSDLLRYWGLVHLCDVLKENRIEQSEDLSKTDFTSLAKAIENTANSLELEMLRRMRERLMTDSQASITWEMDIEAVKDRSLDAMNLLSTASLMHCTAIPLSVLGRATFTDCTDDDLERQSRVNSSMSTLAAFSLVQEDRENETCALHSLIQQAVEEHMMREGTLSSRLQSTCRYLLTILPQAWDGCRRRLKDSRLLALAPHLYSIADTILSAEMLTCRECWQLLQIVCWLAIQYGHLDKARSLTERRLGIAQRTFTDGLIVSDARKLVRCKRVDTPLDVVRNC